MCASKELGGASPALLGLNVWSELASYPKVEKCRLGDPEEPYPIVTPDLPFLAPRHSYPGYAVSGFYHGRTDSR